MFALRARRWGAVVAGVVIVGGLLVGTVPAVASVHGAKASPWTATTAPLPADAEADPLSVVISETCPAAGSCVAVGAYLDASGAQQGLIETLSGGVWTSALAPLPANAATNPEAAITAVSCSAVGSCVAVGGYVAKKAKKAQGSGLVEVLSGGTWTPEQELLAGFTDVEFAALTCPAVGSCVAVGGGTSSTSSGGVIGTLSDGSWTLTAAPLPPTAPTGAEGFLSSVTCPAVGACVAAGYEIALGATSVTEEGFTETLSAGQWTATAASVASKKSSPTLSLLQSVACPTAGSCLAGGIMADKSHKAGEGLLETLANGNWSSVNVPLPPDANPGLSGQFSDVSCPAVGVCVAASDYVDTSGNQQALIETLNGGTWTAIEAPLPADAGADPLAALGGVTCPSPGSCVAVGSYTNATGAELGLVDTLSDGTWTATEAPLPASTPGIVLDTSESTSASAFATATDVATRLATTGGLRLVRTPTRTTARKILETRAFNSGLAATGTAAGSPNASKRKAFFTVAPVLSTVSCVTTDACVAAGITFAADSEVGVTETLSAATWTVSDAVPAGAVENTLASLNAVSCGGPAPCTAVGIYGDTSGETQGLVDSQTGETWSPSEMPVPVDTGPDPLVEFDGISCPAAGSCVVVGTYLNTDGNLQAVVETLAGGTWTASGVPSPAGTTNPNAELNAVACPSEGSCVAVGATFSATGRQGQALVETLSDGTWTGSVPPSPGKASLKSDAGLNAVSCPTVGSCQAVGSYASKKVSLGLVETLANGTWTATEVPAPASAAGDSLSGVSCAEVGTCEAVGTYGDGEVLDGFIATLSDGTWTESEAPSPSKSSEESTLSSVSCPSSGGCVAVGSFIGASGSTGEPFIGSYFLTLHGKKWTVTQAPAPAGSIFLSLTSVSCASVGSCVSVGSEATTTGSSAGVIETL